MTILPGSEIDLSAVEQAVQQATLDGMRMGMQYVANDAKRAVARGHKTGRIYRRGGVSHQASAPGEPPATDTGALVNSIAGDAVISGGVVQGIIRAAVHYAAWLELGTRRMVARPFLAPAVIANTQRVMLFVLEAFQRGETRFVRK